ncbi:MAG: type II toxin-antitoxin system HicB family antitoxin [Bacillota bacterium]|jgi:predicted RNase H-like HicB family nuclease
MAKYIYPAVFDPNECGGYTITFPDLPGCVTEGDTLDDAIRMASEALALHLYGMERDGDEISSPSKPTSVHLPSDAFVTLVTARTEPIRDEIRNKSIKKTLTIPQWLNEEAEKEGINFSQVLQYALKEKLGLTERP